MRTLLALLLVLCGFRFIDVHRDHRIRRLGTRAQADEFHAEFTAEDGLCFLEEGLEDFGIGSAEDCGVSAANMGRVWEHTFFVDIVFP